MSNNTEVFSVVRKLDDEIMDTCAIVERVLSPEGRARLTEEKAGEDLHKICDRVIRFSGLADLVGQDGNVTVLHDIARRYGPARLVSPGQPDPICVLAILAYMLSGHGAASRNDDEECPLSGEALDALCPKSIIMMAFTLGLNTADGLMRAEVEKTLARKIENILGGEYGDDPSGGDE